jgi:hypothetical protein
MEVTCMHDLIRARPTSNSPRSEDRHLSADAVPRERVSRQERQEMYELLERYFENTSYAQFDTDLAEKDTVILLRDAATSRVAGFSTLMTLPALVDGRPVMGFFSGDTIVAREHWGSSLLGRHWLATVFGEADRIRQQSPETAFYWLLISSGYKTWRYLPIFFRSYAPHPRLAPAPFDRKVMQTLAATKFGDEYHPDLGIIRFRCANPLRPGVAEITARRVRDPLVEFFVRLNPGHARGDELVCLAPICRSNLTRAGHRLLEPGDGR